MRVIQRAKRAGAKRALNCLVQGRLSIQGELAKTRRGMTKNTPSLVYVQSVALPHPIAQAHALPAALCIMNDVLIMPAPGIHFSGCITFGRVRYFYCSTISLITVANSYPLLHYVLLFCGSVWLNGLQGAVKVVEEEEVGVVRGRGKDCREYLMSQKGV